MDKGEKEALTFRDKLGKILMSLGIGFLMLGIIILVSIAVSLIAPFLEDGGNIFLPGVISYRALLLIVIAGVALVRLSFYTVKK